MAGLFALAAPGLALAGAGDLATTIAPISTNVTYSQLASTARPAHPALTSYIGYQVGVANVGGNTINNIYVQFPAAVPATDSNELAQFDPAQTLGATCTVSSGTVTCSVGQLQAGNAYPTFAVFFQAPVLDPANTAASGSVTFSATTYYAEGTGGLTTSVPQNSAYSTTSLPVGLGTANPTLVKSVVPKSGASLFTGSNNPTSTNPVTTAVVVPAIQSFTTAQIEISAPDIVNCNDFTACSSSQLTIPGLFSPYLQIVLRQDASTIPSKTKIENVTIQYTADDGTVTNLTLPSNLCPSPTTPRTDGVPCIASYVYYKNKSVPGWTADLNGDFEWTLLNIHNGAYKAF